MTDSILKNGEKAVFALRSLYRQYGYTQYKMSKFEEYDLYARNKDFLISDNIITFTDLNGKLMALKPDVTLSIIRSGSDVPGYVQKVYYNENVYRVAKGARSFSEIMQVGLEAIGDIDDYCISEVLLLAAKSLESISGESVLAVSHLGIVSAAIDALGISSAFTGRILKCLGEKNLHELSAICSEAGADGSAAAKLKALLSLCGAPEEIILKLREMNVDSACVSQLENVLAPAMDAGLGNMLRIDFSIVSDMRYYNGIAFKGFIDRVPAAVVSGGQYDKLMKKMGRKSGAIGFAVYLDLLERFFADGSEYDVDTVLLYSADDDMSAVHSAAARLKAECGSVTAQKSLPEKLKYRRALKLCGSEWEEVIENA